MKPTIGRIVILHMSQWMQTQLALRGGHVNDTPDLPAVIVRVWSDDLVNLKVLTDATEDLWVTSVHQGTNPGEWSWPERV